MLREISKVRQVDGEPTKRRYMDDYFDLVIWQMEDQGVVGFQLCYDRQHGEHAFAWQQGSGFSHHEVDNGESLPGKYKATPVLAEDGTFNMEEVATKFLSHGETLDPKTRDFIYQKLLQYPMG